VKSAPLASPSSAPASQPTTLRLHVEGDWKWQDPPKFYPCTVRTEEEWYCLSVMDAVNFLHWQNEQRSGFARALNAAQADKETETVRRVSTVNGAGSSLGVVLGVAAAMLAVGIGAGFGLGFYTAKKLP
jgi:hypothetical protein